MRARSTNEVSPDAITALADTKALKKIGAAAFDALKKRFEVTIDA